MTTPALDLSLEYRTSRSYAIRFRSVTDWDGNTGVDLTSLPNRWHTNDPTDLRRIAELATKAADWLEREVSA